MDWTLSARSEGSVKTIGLLDISRTISDGENSEVIRPSDTVLLRTSRSNGVISGNLSDPITIMNICLHEMSLNLSPM